MTFQTGNLTVQRLLSVAGVVGLSPWIVQLPFWTPWVCWLKLPLSPLLPTLHYEYKYIMKISITFNRK